MTKKCITQVNIPTVDNTQLECDEIISSTCIVVKEYCKKVGNLEGENLDQFIGRLCAKLAVMDNKIYLLTQEVERLRTVQEGLLPVLPEDSPEVPISNGE